MVGEIIGLVGTLANMISGFAADSSHAQSEEQLQKLRDKQKLAASWNKAEGLYRSDLGKGLPGYESEYSDILSRIPTTLNESKDYMTSGGAQELISKLFPQQNQALRNLNAANPTAIQGNKD